MHFLLFLQLSLSLLIIAQPLKLYSMNVEEHIVKEVLQANENLTNEFTLSKTYKIYSVQGLMPEGHSSLTNMCNLLLEDYDSSITSYLIEQGPIVALEKLDNNQLLIATENNIFLWDVLKKKTITSLVHENINQVSIYDNQTILFSTENILYLWDIDKNDVIEKHRFGANINTIACYNLKWILVGLQDGLINIHDIEKQDEYDITPESKSAVDKIIVLSDTNFIVALRNFDVCYYKFDQEKPLNVKAVHKMPLTDIVRLDDTHFATASADGYCKFFACTDQTVTEQQSFKTSTIRLFKCDKNHVVMINKKGVLNILNWQNRTVAASIRIEIDKGAFFLPSTMINDCIIGVTLKDNSIQFYDVPFGMSPSLVAFIVTLKKQQQAEESVLLHDSWHSLYEQLPARYQNYFSDTIVLKQKGILSCIDQCILI